VKPSKPVIDRFIRKPDAVVLTPVDRSRFDRIDTARSIRCAEERTSGRSFGDRSSQVCIGRAKPPGFAGRFFILILLFAVAETP
jgi:hypothetical protein